MLVYCSKAQGGSPNPLTLVDQRQPGIVTSSKTKASLKERYSLDALRQRLAERDALAALAVMAVVVGVATGAVTLAFRIAIEGTLSVALGGDGEGFESLPIWLRVALPISGAALIALALNHLSPSSRRVGVVHVMERLGRHQGRLPLRNAVIQFFGGIVALITGNSGGREGPAVHLGAASGSLLGHAMELPNNAMRTLVACGTAAAIAGSFNTPIAGVIFAMEVVMMEYTIRSFIPVIIAAVMATLMSHGLLGNESLFTMPPLQMQSLFEVPYIMLAGIVFGAVAAAFISATRWFARFDSSPYWQRALLAGCITAGIAVFVPQVMGVGYDTVNGAIAGEFGLWLLLAIVGAKIVASAAAVGLGLPVGLIGPTLVVGATLGGAFGYLAALVTPGSEETIALYVVLGMGAMMAAVLQAPLAALLAVLELTGNPGIILPAMLAIVIATLVSSEVFRQPSAFLSTIKVLGLQYPLPPVTLAMQKVGVTNVMDRRFERLPAVVPRETLRASIAREPSWLLVENDDHDILCSLRASDVDAFLQEREDIEDIKLMEVPGERNDIADINHTATLFEAHERLTEGSAEALCVRRLSAPMIATVQGIITRQDIEQIRKNIK